MVASLSQSADELSKSQAALQEAWGFELWGIGLHMDVLDGWSLCNYPRLADILYYEACSQLRLAQAMEGASSDEDFYKPAMLRAEKALEDYGSASEAARKMAKVGKPKSSG